MNLCAASTANLSISHVFGVPKYRHNKENPPHQYEIIAGSPGSSLVLAETTAGQLRELASNRMRRSPCQSGASHLIMNNVSADVMTPEQILLSYCSRWFFELLFAELKGACQMRKILSKKQQVVRELVLSSAIRLMVSRVVLMNLLQQSITGSRRRKNAEMSEFIKRELVRRTPTKQFVRVWDELSLLFLPEVLRAAGIQ